MHIKKNTNDYHHKNLKDVLIVKALELLDEKPYESITVRELTDSIGVSRTAIYRHFSSKEHLFQAVILKGFDQLAEAMQPIYNDGSKSIEEKFYGIGECYINFALASPPRYRLMMGDKLMNIREESCDMPNTSVEGSFSIMISLVADAQDKGLFKVHDPMQQAIVIWSVIHGQASLLMDGHPMVREQKEPIKELMFEMIMQGLR